MILSQITVLTRLVLWIGIELVFFSKYFSYLSLTYAHLVVKIVQTERSTKNISEFFLEKQLQQQLTGERYWQRDILQSSLI